MIWGSRSTINCFFLWFSYDRLCISIEFHRAWLDNFSGTMNFRFLRWMWLGDKKTERHFWQHHKPQQVDRWPVRWPVVWGGRLYQFLGELRRHEVTRSQFFVCLTKKKSAKDIESTFIEKVQNLERGGDEWLGNKDGERHSMGIFDGNPA